MTNIQDEIMQKCLDKANILLDSETTPTAETAEAVKGLVEAAFTINKMEQSLNQYLNPR